MTEDKGRLLVSTNRILYDNEKYRDESKVRKLHRKVAATMVVFLVAWLAVIFLLDFILSQGLDSNGLWVRVTVVASLTLLVGYLVAHSIYAHVKLLAIQLEVTERGIVICRPRREVLEFSSIDRVIFSDRYVEIMVKNQGENPRPYLLDADIIWDAKRFRRELSRYCNVESQ
ncbi:MAG: hypothetical protein ACE5IO_03825 [Thermoplasmata archaeon]